MIEQVGPGVTGLAAGDHVILSFSSCGHCPSCLMGMPSGCLYMGQFNFGGVMLDGTTRISQNAQSIGTFFGQSSFAYYAVSHQRNVVKVPSDLSLEQLAPLGCGISTGSGAVINKLKPEPGSSIAVFGCGAVGLSAVMAAVIKGCTTIIAVDVHPNRLELALELGATHVINADNQDAREKILEWTGSGVRYAVETSGNPKVLRQAVDSTSILGTTAIVGAPPAGTPVEFDVFTLLFERSVTGVIMGSAVPQVFIPQLIELYRNGRFPFDKLTKFYNLEEIGLAAEDSETGKTVKPIMRVG